MIRLENVNKYFNKRKKNELHVINNTSLELPDHGLVALLGPSGSGKTTLLNAIGGLDSVNSGNIYINNEKITRKRSKKIDKIRNLNIGYIFQNYYLVDSLSVYDNVALSLKMIGIKNKAEIKKRVNYVLEHLDIYRYRNREASMLSGGERQRVGIARAIVKNPNIIIADEPTGNLDSSNTIAIMNIIKSIASKRLVILVTHENELAHFYADQIIELEDGKIINNYQNNHHNNLDYKIDNKIYLKDFAYQTTLNDQNNNIKIFSDNKKELNFTIVVKNNNIYIKGNEKNKIEVIDDNSNIELINDKYKQIDKSVYEEYKFDFESELKNPQKIKYSSVLNSFSLLTNGFKKVRDYSFIKKMLLIGFLASAAFITYSVSNIFGTLKIEDSYFIEKNHNYYDVLMGNINVDRYLEYEQLSSVDYILPGEGFINFKVTFPYYYQTRNANSILSGSLTSLDYISESDLIYGKMPENDYEIVVDEMAIKNMLKNNETPALVGYKNADKYLGKEVYLKNMKSFKIVGITSKEDPSIYANKSLFINMLANNYNEENRYFYDTYAGDFSHDNDLESVTYLDYTLNDIKLKSGKMPENDYEVVINNTQKDVYKLNRTINIKINGEKLKVVGYYEGDGNYYYVNGNTIKYNLINSSSNLTIMPKEANKIEEDFNNENLSITSSYETSLKEYKLQRKSSVKASLIVSGIILVISFIEIYLMIRASFLSRIKEIGIYRAIGVKKADIYKMFYGEIFAITTLTAIPAVLIISYSLKSLMTISYFEQNYVVNIITIIISLLVIYVFNLCMGLLPVAGVVRQKPAKILARKDID